MTNDIRSIRIKRGIKQSDLAKQIQVSVTVLSKWERGLEFPPSDVLIRIAEVLGCDSENLFLAQKAYTNQVIPGEGYTTVKSNQELFLPRKYKMGTDKFNVLDVFCGSGGLSYGFDAVDKFQVTCGIDLLVDRVKTFHLNHPYAIGIASDMRQFPLHKLTDYALQPDIVVGGPPCQGFSSIRPFRTLTEGDNRNNLIELYLLTVAQLKPQWFVFENVVGLLTHKKGLVLESLLKGFTDIGYTVDWRVINSAYYGVPQNRERLFIVGNTISTQFNWPRPTHYTEHRSMAGKRSQVIVPTPLLDQPLKPSVTVMEAIHDLPPIEAGGCADKYRDDVVLTEYESKMREGSVQLTLHQSTNHSERMIEIIKQAGTNRYSLPQEYTSSGFSSCYSRLDANKPSTTLTVNFVHPSSNRCIHPYQNRALTPREGARLQGFLDKYQFYGTRPQVVKQIGNAVPPLLSQILAEAIAEQFD